MSNVTFYKNGKPEGRQYDLQYEYLPVYRYETVKPVKPSNGLVTVVNALYPVASAIASVVIFYALYVLASFL